MKCRSCGHEVKYDSESQMLSCPCGIENGTAHADGCPCCGTEMVPVDENDTGEDGVEIECQNCGYTCERGE